ncbi:MAG TPA: 2,3-diaminopropionate biosynthesis protein SbnB [Pyrinomonadaceae bacterium]
MDNIDNDDILILKGKEVAEILTGRERDLIEVVRVAYKAHAAGKSSLPHSTFLRFLESEKNRIIALPAYLGDGFGVAGIKWISSFPDNLSLGLDRASAVLILNSTTTGRPEAIVEGSIISARRTAASAALAAETLLEGKEVESVGMVGCGLINYETARFLRAALPGLKRLTIFDLDRARAEQFKRVCGELFEERAVADDLRSLLRENKLVAFATTAVRPHVSDLSDCAPGSLILHTSLRDLTPEVILSCDNVVDDVDHVSRAQTSIHLAEQLAGDRSFVRCTLGDILLGREPARRDDESVTVFSPFGLGILDLAVGKYVCDRGVEQSKGSVISSFLPSTWVEGRA